MVTHLLSETKHRIRYYIQRLDDTSLKASVDQFYKREKGIELAPVSPTPSSKQTYAPISPGKLLGAIAPVRALGTSPHHEKWRYSGRHCRSRS